MLDSSVTPISCTCGPQPAVFTYFHFDSSIHTHEKPFEILINLPSAVVNSPGYRRSNQEFEKRETIVEDVRGREWKFNLDKEGFCWKNWEGPQSWLGVDGSGVQSKGHHAIESEYLREVEGFIKEEFEREGQSVEKVKVFDYKLRLSMDEKAFAKRTVNLDDGLDPMIPVTHPHVDQSFEGAVKRVHYHMKDEAPDLLRRRFRIVNVWKPLKPIKSWPLAICDTSTVQQTDLIASDLVRRKFVGETFYSLYNPNHRWYYLSDQQPNEVTMLKIYDSSPRIGANSAYIPHFNFLVLVLKKYEKVSR